MHITAPPNARFAHIHSLKLSHTHTHTWTRARSADARVLRWLRRTACVSQRDWITMWRRRHQQSSRMTCVCARPNRPNARLVYSYRCFHFFFFFLLLCMCSLFFSLWLEWTAGTSRTSTSDGEFNTQYYGDTHFSLSIILHFKRNVRASLSFFF